MMKNSRNKKAALWLAALCAVLWLACAPALEAAPRGGKKSGKGRKAKTEAAAPAPSRYRSLTGRDSVEWQGVMNVVERGDTLLVELPVRLLGRVFLVSNKLQRVPSELNEAMATRGVNYESQMVRFEWDRRAKLLRLRQQRVTPEVDPAERMAPSVADNYLDPVLTTLKVEAVSPDSSSVLFKAGDLFNGKKNILNDVFNAINIGTSPLSELSRIISVRSYPQSLVATSELTTRVTEGSSKVYLSVEVTTALLLLPEHPMPARLEDWRVGYFSVPSTRYADRQQRVEHRSYATRWRLTPSDTVAYMRGELVEPLRPITFCIGPAVPDHLRPYIRQGLLDWNRAFERAGFRNAVRVIDPQDGSPLQPEDTLGLEGDDLRHSVLTYDASEKANAMGPSTLDPRTGEILEADIIWWHNVQSLISEWVRVQTSAVDPRARTLNLPDELIGQAVRFVACHEAGHSLGLRHNMIASAAYPTDSLRSPSFTRRMGGTSASIMDYARFNYVAQPQDGVSQLAPAIGPYDLMAIEWGYRWYPHGTDEAQALADLLSRHQGPEYRYSETQPQRSAVDPRALSEDLGDDPVKAARLGIENLKRIMPHLTDWTRNGQPAQNLDEAASLYAAVIYQWSLYLYHVMANVGGIELHRPVLDPSAPQGISSPAYTFTPKARQQQALQFLIDEGLKTPRWLFLTPLTRHIWPQRSTPLGPTEQEPAMLLRNQHNYILWDLLANDRIIRMQENEWLNGTDAFTPAQLFDQLHQAIFAKTIAGQDLDAMERSLQKSLVDALITAAAESEGVKINKNIAPAAPSSAATAAPSSADGRPWTQDGSSPWLLAQTPLLPCEAAERAVRTSRARTLDMTTSQVTRTSDAISLKRGELLRILRLCQSRSGSGSTATRMHYADMALRIQTALGLQK